MTATSTPAAPASNGRYGRDLRAAVISGVLLGVTVLASLLIAKTAFLVVVLVAAGVAVWELHRGLVNVGVDIPE
ncbi:MAG: phosphatidate cytidylyltransferase, partial [Marmoricola sp.]